jgi:hypothetical protein
MIKKEIRKFFNSVPVQENMLSWLDEEKKKAFPFSWIVLSVIVGIGVIGGILMLLKEDFADSESD